MIHVLPSHGNRNMAAKAAICFKVVRDLEAENEASFRQNKTCLLRKYSCNNYFGK